MFKDRSDAGRKLAEALQSYEDEDVLILAVPRGGVEVGYEVAKGLEADFSVLVTRKLPFPDNPESGFGAIAEDGSTFVHEQHVRMMPQATVEQIKEQQRQEIERRIEALRGGRGLPRIEGRTVIVVDDGIAMGSTMRASLMLCRNKGAGKTVAAAPVAGPTVRERLGDPADDVVIVEQPPNFHAVAQVYMNWYDVPDGEVIEILQRWEREQE